MAHDKDCAICGEIASEGICSGCLNEAVGYDRGASFESEGAE